MPTTSSSTVVRVLTVNTHKGFTSFNRRFMLHELRDAIRATGADIVFLQEVLGEHHHHRKRFTRWPDVSQYEFLADSIWPEFAYGRNASYPHGHHGNAVLSKFPILQTCNHDVSVGKHERRGLLHCIMKLPGTAQGHLHAVCVHLGLREAHRRTQLDSLCRIVSKEVPAGTPLVVAGDFNDWRLKAQRMLMHSTRIREVYCDTQGNVARTFPARYPMLRLDRIYVQDAKHFEAVPLASNPWVDLSDHAPLAAEVHV